MVSLVLTQGQFWLQWWAYFKYLINQLDAKSEAVLALQTIFPSEPLMWLVAAI